MEDKKFTNREIDKIELSKSKKLMWSYIQKKIDEKEQEKKESFWERFKSLFVIPQKALSMGAIAVVLVVAILFGNFTGLFGNENNVAHANFEMVADNQDSAGVDVNSTFTLTSSEDYSAKFIRERLKVSPGVDFDVEKIGDGKYRVKPAQSLEGNKIYNFTIESLVKDENGETKRIEFSWAYQVKDNFKVTGTLPGNASTSVPINTGIEINFSHENVDLGTLEKFVEISPAVSGKFEKHRKIISFVPKKNLQAGQLYKFTIKKGLPLSGSDKVLQEDYSFAFETSGVEKQISGGFNFTRDMYEFNTKSALGFEAYTYAIEKNQPLNLYDEAGTLIPQERDPVTVKVYRYKGMEAFKEAVEEKTDIPSWAYYSQSFFKHDTSKLEFMGEFDALVDEMNYMSYIYLPKAQLKPGFYLAEAKYLDNSTQALFQITDLSVYYDVTVTDSIFWLNDLATGKPVKDVKIKIDDVDEVYKTDESGIAKIKTPEKLKIGGESYFQFESPDGKKLLSKESVFRYESNVSSNFWNLFFTDRSKYKPNDTIRFFGFIKPKDDRSKVKDVKIVLMRDYNTVVKEQRVSLNPDNSFEGKFDLTNLKPGYYSLEFYNDDDYISSEYLDIESYKKPAFGLKLDIDKKAVFIGDKVNYTVKSEFFDGTPYPNLQVSVLNGKDTVYTDEQGNYAGTVSTDKINYGSLVSNYYVDAAVRNAEEGDIFASQYVEVFNSNLALNTENEVKDNNAKIKISANYVDLTKKSSGESDDFLGNPAPNKDVAVTLTEVYWKKVQDGEYYDFINKIKRKSYKYEESRKGLGVFNVKTDDKGKAVYEFKMDPEKYYKVTLASVDDQGRSTSTESYIYGSSGRTYAYDFFDLKILGKNDQFDNSFAIGENVQTVFALAGKPVIPEKGSRFLFMQHNNGLQEYTVKDNPNYSFKFSENNLPRVVASGVWFDGEKYSKAYTQINFDTELKALNLEIKSDKKEYKPGDQITLKTKVTDVNGKGVKSRVHINLTDEAYFKIAYDNFSNPLEDLYSLNTYYNNDGVLWDYYSHYNPFTKVFSDEGGMGGCFTGDTQILMGDGTYKAIKDIKKGDIILTKKSEFSGEMVKAKVNNTVSHYVSEYLVINENLEVTPVHIMFINGKWDVADKIRLEDVLLGKNGELVKVESVRKVNKSVWVYNFEVDGYHTYFANNFYVHNDKGGGGESYVRSKFEDIAYFNSVETDEGGNAEVTFKLPDNITSWRVMARAIDTVNLAGGSKIENVKVSQPFFTDVVANEEYSEKDIPIIKVRAFGNALKKDSNVDFTVKGLAEGKVSAKAFTDGYLEIPKLTKGQANLQVNAKSGNLKDAIKREINITGSRLDKKASEFIRKIEDGVLEISMDGFKEVTLIDGGIAYYYNELASLYLTSGDRIDQRLSQIISADLVKKYFGESWNSSSEDLVENYQLKSGGLVLLPYSSEDLKLTTLAVLVDSNKSRFDAASIKNYFNGFYMNKDANLDEIVLSLLGLASLNEPVLLSLQAITNEEKLSLEDKLYIGLAFAELGDNSSAQKIFAKVKDKAQKSKDVEIKALAAWLAAALHEDQVAAEFMSDVDKLTGEDDFMNLYKLGYVKNSLKTANPSEVLAYLDVDGESEKIQLGPWNTFSFMIDKKKVKLDVKKGTIAAVVNYELPVDVDTFKGDDRIQINREYRKLGGGKSNTFKEGDVVQVVIKINDKVNDKKLSFYEITDVLPSGLAAITTPRSWVDPWSGTTNSNYYPYRIDGQKVYFFWSSFHSQEDITYLARIVNPGKFYADPAMVQSLNDLSIVNISQPALVEIGKK